MTEFTIQDFSLEGKAALITGVSYGIGFAITQAFHQTGAVSFLTIEIKNR